MINDFKFIKKLIKNRALLWPIIVGNFRTIFFLCPECNSDAPKMYSCPVCKGEVKTSFKDWYHRIRELWWARYKELHKF